MFIALYVASFLTGVIIWCVNSSDLYPAYDHEYKFIYFTIWLTIFGFTGLIVSVFS